MFSTLSHENSPVPGLGMYSGSPAPPGGPPRGRGYGSVNGGGGGGVPGNKVVTPHASKSAGNGGDETRPLLSLNAEDKKDAPPSGGLTKLFK